MPMIRVQLVGADKVRREFGDIGANQMPFAIALALTKTAQAAQPAVRESLPQKFTIRRLAFMQGNIKIKAATKALPQATIFDNFDAMVKEEVGGDKVPYGGSAIAVPLSGARATPMQLIAAKDRPKKVMQNGGFIRDGIMYAVPKRVQVGRVSWGRGQQGPKLPFRVQGPIRPVPMYALVPRVRVKPRYDMEKTVASTVGRTFKLNFDYAMARAVRTARKG